MLEGISAEPWGANSITLAEALVTPARLGHLEEVEAVLVGLDVQELPMGSGAQGRLAEMRADVGLRMPDCCVLLTAQNNEAALATFDADMLSAAGKLGIDLVPDPSR